MDNGLNGTRLGRRKEKEIKQMEKKMGNGLNGIKIGRNLKERTWMGKKMGNGLIGSCTTMD